VDIHVTILNFVNAKNLVVNRNRWTWATATHLFTNKYIRIFLPGRNILLYSSQIHYRDNN